MLLSILPRGREVAGVENVRIVGAGGFGLEVLAYAQEAHAQGWPYRAIGFIEDALPIGSEVDDGIAVEGGTDDASVMSGAVVIAVGDADTRALLEAKVVAHGGRLVTLVHPTAYVARSALIDAGSVVCPFAMVGARAVVGRNVAVNVYASVGHEASVGDHSVLSPYAAILGRARLGPRCYAATHATVMPGVDVGGQSKISVGSAVMRDAPAGSMLVGNPAKGRVLFPVEES